MNKKYIIYLLVPLIILTLGLTKDKTVKNDNKGLYIIYSDNSSLASETISSGWNKIKEFTIENQSSKNEVYDIYIEGLVNTFVTTGYLQYKIISPNGYNMTEYKDIPKSNTSKDVVLANNIPINKNEKQSYKVELIYKDNEDQSSDLGKTLSGTLGIKVETKELITLTDAMLRDNKSIKERNDFNDVNISNTTGTLYKTNKTEDNSTVYYYSGNTTNNWVKFGKYITTDTTNSLWNENDDMYWRIIRTNEDGSVRLLYSGTSPDTEEAYIRRSRYNLAFDDTIYVGYMYGTTGSLESNRTNTNDGNIKKSLDEWYKDNLLTNYDKYISKSAIYCNDRSVGSGTYYAKGNTFYYGAYTRIQTNKSPSYKCGANTSNGLFESTQAIEDKFSASTTGGGNGKLTYPIALMTADEVVFAGGKVLKGLSSPYAWYYTNSVGNSITNTIPWWTMTPAYLGGYNPIMYYVVGSGNPAYLNNGGVYDLNSTRPVISLNKCVKVTGIGTPDDPYVVDYENSCTN